jgi:hypothetical protein
MTTQALIIKTESWTQQELQAQARMLELLDAQERAIAEGSTKGISLYGEKIQAHLRSGPIRERRRMELMHRFAATWGIAAGTLSLGSIAERARAEGVATVRMERLREDLRRTTAQVLRKGRRLAAMARYHQGLLGEIMEVLLTGQGHPASTGITASEEGGVLVNREA